MPPTSRALAISGVPAALTLFALSPILRDLGRRSRTYRARHTARQSIGPLESAIALGVASYASAEMLERFVVPHERHIVSAHRTPTWLAEFAHGAEGRGVEVIIAGAGGAAHGAYALIQVGQNRELRALGGRCVLAMRPQKT